MLPRSPPLAAAFLRPPPPWAHPDRFDNENDETHRDLLQLIDHTRDETLPSLGVHVHDEPDNQCTWMVLPPDQRKSRRRSEDQADARGQAGGGTGGVKGATLPGDAMWADGDEEEPPLPGGIPVPPAAVGDDRRGG